MVNSFDELIGKTLLVGLTYMDKEKNVLGRSQYYCLILDANQKDGIKVKRYGIGDIEYLPPDLSSYYKAEPGVYTLKNSGLNIENPDYTCLWNVVTEKKP